MDPIIVFDPRYSGGEVLNDILTESFGTEHARSYPPAPASLGCQVEIGALDNWFNGFSALSVNFHAERNELPYQMPYRTVTVLSHPFDYLYRQYVETISRYLRFPEYAEARRLLPAELNAFGAFASLAGLDNPLVRFFTRLEIDQAVTWGHARQALAAVNAVDYTIYMPPLFRPTESENGSARWLHDQLTILLADHRSVAPMITAAVDVALEKARRVHDIFCSRPMDHTPPEAVKAMDPGMVRDHGLAPALPFPKRLAEWLAWRNRFDLDLLGGLKTSARAAAGAEETPS